MLAHLPPTRERAHGSSVNFARTEDVAICYSRAWYEETERKAREAKEREAQAKRADTVRTMMSEAERRAQEQKARESAKEPAPAK
jgi:hypothetical protein